MSFSRTLCKNTDFACLSHNYQLQEDSKDLGSFFFLAALEGLPGLSLLTRR